MSLSRARHAIARILIAEDNETLLRTCVDLFNHNKYYVVTALEGADAIRKHRNQKFDLVITDLRLPKLAGTTLLEAFREKGPSSDAPIIVTSGYLDDLMQNSFKTKGVMQFLPKPYGVNELLRIATELIQHKRISKIDFDINLINPFLFSTIHTVSTMAGITLVAKQPYIKSHEEVSGDISGLVVVTKPKFSASVSLSFHEASYLALLKRVLQLEFAKITDQNKGSAGELMNMIFCQAKKALNDRGAGLTSVFPTVISRPHHSVNHLSLDPVVVVQFDSEIASFCRLEICARS